MIVGLTVRSFFLCLLFATVPARAGETFFYVANTSPPDAFLALKSYPSSRSPRVSALANGTKLDVLLKRADGWWYVKVVTTNEEGWAFSGQGGRAYIMCCTDNAGAEVETPPVSNSVAQFSCDQLWFSRNSLYKEAGYCFKTQRAIAAFGNAGCNFDNIDDVKLTPENRNFADAIQMAEKAKLCAR